MIPPIELRNSTVDELFILLRKLDLYALEYDDRFCDPALRAAVVAELQRRGIKQLPPLKV